MIVRRLIFVNVVTICQALLSINYDILLNMVSHGRTQRGSGGVQRKLYK